MSNPDTGVEQHDELLVAIKLLVVGLGVTSFCDHTLLLLMVPLVRHGH